MERTSFLPNLKMKTPTAIKSLCAEILASVLSASAGIHPLPTPPPSEFADAESSVTVPLPATEGRYLRLTLAFDPSPTNAVQVAFGIDANHDNDLAPEETAVRVGCDCGVWFAHEEVVVGSPSPTVEWSNLHCTTTTTNYNYVLKQPSAGSARWTHAKITTHNLAATNLAVTANFYNQGFALLLR